MKLDTQLVHAGEPHPRIEGAVAMPVFQSSTFEYRDEDSYHDIRYIRLNNTPTHAALHRKLAAIEGGEAALSTASGMAAISAALLATLSTGDHLLVQNGLYGGTHSVIAKDMARFGITHSFLDATRPDTWDAALRPGTKAIYTEAMTNPMLEVADHAAVVQFAQKNRLVSLIDSTFATPVNFKPLMLGYDLVLHSCTKYFNGHSDLVAGAVIGRKELVENVTHLANHLGGCLDPHACFLLDRGLKTLSLRMARHNENGQRLAEFLASHPKVERVHYPGLETSPHHQRARRHFTGFGGVVGFVPKGGAAAASRIVRAVKIPAHAASLGGVESLILQPAGSTHQEMADAEKKKLGISPDLIRYSAGIEAADDLIADLAEALG